MTMPPTAANVAKANGNGNGGVAVKAAPDTSSLNIVSGITRSSQRVLIYGAGGIGKTKLAVSLGQLGQKVLVIDLEGGSVDMDVDRVPPESLDTYGQLLAALRDPVLDTYDAIVIDTLTKAEELCVTHTLENVPHPDKGVMVDSIESYGYGKGYQLVAREWLHLMKAMDDIFATGRINVITVAHDCTTNVPNPSGEDWIRYEPRLQSPPSGKGSIRHIVREWVDQMLYIGYDVAVSKDGKAVGHGSRTIYTAELPTAWAKNRGIGDTPVPYTEGDVEIWRRIFKESN
jgi:hypothetical protein